MLLQQLRGCFRPLWPLQKARFGHTFLLQERKSFEMIVSPVGMIIALQKVPMRLFNDEVY